MVLLDWSEEFGIWLDRLEARADAGNPVTNRALRLVTAQLEVLQDLDTEPTETEETATLERVRQSRGTTRYGESPTRTTPTWRYD